MFHDVFKNERDREIDLRIDAAPSTDTLMGVRITLTGPDSQSENILTPLEAARLAQGLAAYLAQAGISLK